MSEIADKRVLLIDDSKFVRTTFNRILGDSFTVLEAADGEAAWQAIETDPLIALVFSDLDMPKLDGYGLLARVRGSGEQRIRELPVIVISGHEDALARKRAKDAGASEFIGKTADGTEILSRIENLLRLGQANRDLETRLQTVQQAAIHEPVTGAFTIHYLMTEGRKHYSHARRHGTELSLVVFRIDNQAELLQSVGKDAAEQLLARIAKTVMGSMRAEDSLARTGEAMFTLVAAGCGAAQALAFARRLQQKLDTSQITWRRQILRIRSSFGVAALGLDKAASVEELIKLAVARLQKAAGMAAAASAAAAAPQAARPELPMDLERALRILEEHRAQRTADNTEILRRLARIAASIKARKAARPGRAKPAPK